MIYPIVAYGDPVLKKKAEEIEPGTDLKELVDNMFETMYEAHGVGLAAPQVGKSVRLFVIDPEPMDEKLKDMKMVFINPVILEEEGDEWAFEEGCLSIPNIRENVHRQSKIRIKYYDIDWNEHEKEYDGMAARVIQHEYDHVEGVLFTDYLSGFKKRLLKSRLVKISKGDVDVDYKMKFPMVTKARK